MNRNSLPTALLLPLLTLWACGAVPTPPATATPTNFRIAFGSCAHQDQPMPLLNVAAGLNADVFVFLGDNIYGDSREMDTLRAKYARLAARPEFRRLKASTPLLATWDDHDYGENDAGRHYPHREASKEIFLDFWEVADTSERRQHPGIHGVTYLEKAGRRVQVLLLDTRTFRDDLLHRDPTETAFKNDYVPNPSPDSTLLGAAQWRWLEQQLRQPADARIVATSNQFGHTYNGWESWTNVPRERERMLQLIRTTGAERLFFISGDVHWGEISRLDAPRLYPLYDVTSSGINRDWDVIEPNANRVGPAIPQHNVGLIELSLAPDGGSARLSIIDATGRPRSATSVDLAELSFGDRP